MNQLKPSGLSQNEKELSWSKIEMNLSPQKRSSPRFSRTFRRIATVLILSVTLMGTGVATASAHSGIMPGDFLFPVEIATEKLQVFLARDLEKKETLRIKFAEERLAEVRALIDVTNSDADLNQALASTTQQTSSGTGTSTGSTATTTATSTSQTSTSTPATSTPPVVGTSGSTTTLFLTKSTIKKIERAERAITIALRELEETRALLLSSGSTEGLLVLDDIIAELKGAGDGSVTITKIAAGGGKKGNSEQVTIRATFTQATSTGTTSASFAGEVKIEEKKRGATIALKSAGTKTQIVVNDKKGSTTVKEKSKKEDHDDDDDQDEDKRDDDNDDRDNKGKNEKKTKICHKDDGKRQTIEVAISAARGHLAHGDSLGKCRDEDDDGDDHTTDTTAPVLSFLSANPGTTTVAITWKTNEPARSQLFIGTISPVSMTAPNAERTNLTTTHSFQLQGLLPQTTYYYVVSSADASGNRTTGGQGSFITGTSGTSTPPPPPPPPADTTAPTISDIHVTATTTSATITWATNEHARSKIWLSTASSVSTDGAPNVEESTFATAHSATLSGLTNGTTYRYVISVLDQAGNRSTTTEAVFTTVAIPPPTPPPPPPPPPPADTTAPVISGINTTTGTTSAIVRWATDESSTGVLYVSEGTPVDTASAVSVGTGIFATNHEASLSGLTASTTYHFLIVAKDSAQNQATSSAQSFTTGG